MADRVTILEPTGMFDSLQGGQVRKQAVAAIAEGTEIVLIDFRQVTLMDSGGLGAMVATLHTAIRENRRLCLCSVTDQVEMIFQLTRSHQLFEIFPDRQAFNRAIGI